MEKNLKKHLEMICMKRMSKKGLDTFLSLETFFCDQSIDINQFAKLTDWWFNQNQFDYFVPATKILTQLENIQKQELKLTN